MKNIIVRGVISGCIASSLLACDAKNEGSAATGVVDKEQIKKDIQAKEDQFASTYNAGQLKDIGYYADDAISFYQGRPPLIGKQAIIDFLKSDIVSNTNKISFKTNEVLVSNDGNQVVEIGCFKVVDSTNSAIDSGNYMSLFAKRDGRYVCLRDMSASDMPSK
jgi:ketosteroid isomerase-like protein